MEPTPTGAWPRGKEIHRAQAVCEVDTQRRMAPISVQQCGHPLLRLSSHRCVLNACKQAVDLAREVVGDRFQVLFE